MIRRRWFEDLNAVGFEAVAERVGIVPGPARSWGPCPACEAEERGADDRRGPLGVTASGEGWACHRCKLTGDVVGLIALLATGETHPADWRPVRAFAAERGWVEAEERGSTSTPPPRPRPRRPRPAPPPPRRIPRGEVEEFWASCRGVLDDREVCSWLEGRGLQPALLEDLGLCRALPLGPLPGWATCRGRSWREAGFGLVLPQLDERGELAGVRGRAVVSGAKPKSAAPAGAEARGLIFGDGLARQVLARGPEGPPVDLVVVEGGPDFLVWASRWGDGAALTTAPAVVGVVAGSWVPELAARIPKGSRVAVRTHQDDAGKKYGAQVVATLEGRAAAFQAREAA